MQPRTVASPWKCRAGKAIASERSNRKRTEQPQARPSRARKGKTMNVNLTAEQAQTIYTALRIERERNREIVAGFPTKENEAILGQIEDAMQAIAKAII